MGRAQTLLDSDPQQALQIAERVTRSGRVPGAYAVATRAACRLGDQSKAQAWFQQVPDKRKRWVRGDCLRHGVSL